MTSRVALSIGLLACSLADGLGVFAETLQAPVRGAQTGAERLPADVFPESRSRLPLAKRDELDALGREMYDEIAKDTRRVTGFQGPGALRLHSPRSGELLRRLNTYLRFESPLGAHTVELAILVAARELDSQFEWAAHEKAALQAGVPQELIELVRHRRAVADVPERDAIVIDLGREALGARRVEPETYARALKVFGPAQLVDLATLIGEYASTAVLLTIVYQQLPLGQDAPLPRR